MNKVEIRVRNFFKKDSVHVILFILIVFFLTIVLSPWMTTKFTWGSKYVTGVIYFELVMATCFIFIFSVKEFLLWNLEMHRKDLRKKSNNTDKQQSLDWLSEKSITESEFNKIFDIQFTYTMNEFERIEKFKNHVFKVAGKQDADYLLKLKILKSRIKQKSLMKNIIGSAIFSLFLSMVVRIIMENFPFKTIIGWFDVVPNLDMYSLINLPVFIFTITMIISLIFDEVTRLSRTKRNILKYLELFIEDEEKKNS